MFLGYQGENISFIGETREELENLPCVTLDRIEKTTDDVELVNGKYCVGKDSIIDAKKEIVRKYRNYLLESEIDPVVSNPLRWNDMSEDDQNMYKNYRLYLLDYTSQDNWWENNPKTLKEWSE